MKNIPVSYFSQVPVDAAEREFADVVRQLADAGARYMAAGLEVMQNAVRPGGPAVVAAMRRTVESAGMAFRGAHAPWGDDWDLNATDPAERTRMLANQRRMIDLAGELAADILVMHPGDMACRDRTPDLAALHEALCRTLDELLPYAEKRGVRIALENIFGRTDGPDQLTAVCREYGTPTLGCCLDTGHANVLEAAPGKTSEQMNAYIRDTIWQGKMRFYPGSVADALAPYVITAHIHDNRGTDDEHLMPGAGSVDWAHVTKCLREDCPRLAFVQNEASWSRHGVTAAENVAAFERLFGGAAR